MEQEEMKTDSAYTTAHAGVGATARCDKCGLPVTTGFMAALCSRGNDCAFYDADNAESVDFFREMFSGPDGRSMEEIEAAVAARSAS
jgi:hypothetical protein